MSYRHNSGEVVSNTVALNVAKLVNLAISDPNIYNLGDTISYSNVTVMAEYSDNTSENVTSAVIYSQSDGIIAARNTSKSVTVTYNKATGVSITGILLLKIRIIKQLEVTAPTKTSYIKGESLDFTGLSVVCRYTDETTADVTSQVSLSHTNGAMVNSSTADTVVVSYTENSETVTGSFKLSLSIIDRLEVTPPTKTAYSSGERLNFAGLTVKCIYTDGTQVDVTTSAVL